MENTNFEKLYIRLVRQANASYMVALLANLLISFILVYILRDTAPHSRLAIWLVVMAAILILRAIYSYYAQFVTYSQAKKNRRIQFLGLALTGMAWGMVSLFLFPEGSLPHQTVICFVIGGMLLGASVTTAALNNAFLFFSIPALLPLIVRFFTVGTEITNAMAIMLLIFLFCLFFISKKIHALIIQTIRSNVEKEKEIEIRKNAENKLQKHQENLENTIAHRTKELYQANIELARQIQERKLSEVKYQAVFNSTNDGMFIQEAPT